MNRGVFFCDEAFFKWRNDDKVFILVGHLFVVFADLGLLNKDKAQKVF